MNIINLYDLHISVNGQPQGSVMLDGAHPLARLCRGERITQADFQQVQRALAGSARQRRRIEAALAQPLRRQRVVQRRRA